MILTGSELRHEYFIRKLEEEYRLDIVLAVQEGQEKSLETYVKSKKAVSEIELAHVTARNQSEIDFFQDYVLGNEKRSKSLQVPKGQVNSADCVSKIKSSNPDLIVCFGASIINSELLRLFKGKFLNVHLGLSPYYRGSGTNVWPIINQEPHLVGCTFMHMDEGVDTGQVIHQLRAKFFLGDSPHSIGNRLIKRMVKVCATILVNFDKLKEVSTIVEKSRVYKQADFDEVACIRLYAACKEIEFDQFGNALNVSGQEIFENDALDFI